MIFLILWIISGFIGMAIGGSKGRGGFGFLMGLLLGFIGWIIVAVMPGAEEKPKLLCPYCRQGINPLATICPHCRSAVTPRKQ